ncbi:MAG: hypothetical protein ACI9XO_003067 [Paraglaciecola sp.]|jgi:hypothetical protein
MFSQENLECGFVSPSDSEYLDLLSEMNPNSSNSAISNQAFTVLLNFIIVRNNEGVSVWDDYENNNQSLYSLVEYTNSFFLDLIYLSTFVRLHQ